MAIIEPVPLTANNFHGHRLDELHVDSRERSPRAKTLCSAMKDAEPDKRTFTIKGRTYTCRIANQHYTCIGTCPDGTVLKISSEGHVCIEFHGQWLTANNGSIEEIEAVRIYIARYFNLATGPEAWNPGRTDLKIDFTYNRLHTGKDYGYDSGLTYNSPFQWLGWASHSEPRWREDNFDAGSRKGLYFRLYDKTREILKRMPALDCDADTGDREESWADWLQSNSDVEQLPGEVTVKIINQEIHLHRAEFQFSKQYLKDHGVDSLVDLYRVINDGSLWRTATKAMSFKDPNSRDSNSSRKALARFWEQIQEIRPDGIPLARKPRNVECASAAIDRSIRSAGAASELCRYHFPDDQVAMSLFQEARNALERLREHVTGLWDWKQWQAGIDSVIVKLQRYGLEQSREPETIINLTPTGQNVILRDCDTPVPANRLWPTSTYPPMRY